MVLDTQESLLTYLWNLLTGDTDLKAAMGGEVRLYLTWASPDAGFPYLVHRIDISKEGDLYAVQRAAYYLDIWSNSPSASEALSIRKRIIELLDELVFSTDEASRTHIEIQSDGFVPESDQGIWHYATMWNLIFRRDAESASIEAR